MAIGDISPPLGPHPPTRPPKKAVRDIAIWQWAACMHAASVRATHQYVASPAQFAQACAGDREPAWRSMRDGGMHDAWARTKMHACRMPHAARPDQAQDEWHGLEPGAQAHALASAEACRMLQHARGMPRARHIGASAPPTWPAPGGRAARICSFCLSSQGAWRAVPRGSPPESSRQRAVLQSARLPLRPCLRHTLR